MAKAKQGWATQHVKAFVVGAALWLDLKWRRMKHVRSYHRTIVLQLRPHTLQYTALYTAQYCLNHSLHPSKRFQGVSATDPWKLWLTGYDKFQIWWWRLYSILDCRAFNIKSRTCHYYTGASCPEAPAQSIRGLFKTSIFKTKKTEELLLPLHQKERKRCACQRRPNRILFYILQYIA